MYQLIFELDKELSDEELGKRVRHFRNRIQLSTETTHREIRADNNQLTIPFNPYPREVYCNLTDINLTIIQSSPGSGLYSLNFTQNCTSKWDSNLGGRADWQWTANLYTSTNALLASIYIGAYYHSCGNLARNVSGSWTYPNAPDVITSTASAILTWTYLETVLGC
jgi:hypothetical protein